MQRGDASDALRGPQSSAAVQDDISVELQRLGEAASGELAAWEVTLPRPDQQGRALANWLRGKVGTLTGRVEPEQLLAGWNVPVSMQDFSTRSLDAVAFWAHGRRPTILCNSSEKHQQNEAHGGATLRMSSATCSSIDTDRFPCRRWWVARWSECSKSEQMLLPPNSFTRNRRQAQNFVEIGT